MSKKVRWKVHLKMEMMNLNEDEDAGNNVLNIVRGEMIYSLKINIMSNYLNIFEISYDSEERVKKTNQCATWKTVKDGERPRMDIRVNGDARN